MLKFWRFRLCLLRKSVLCSNPVWLTTNKISSWTPSLAIISLFNLTTRISLICIIFCKIYPKQEFHLAGWSDERVCVGLMWFAITRRPWASSAWGTKWNVCSAYISTQPWSRNLIFFIFIISFPLAAFKIPARYSILACAASRRNLWWNNKRVCSCSVAAVVNLSLCWKGWLKNPRPFMIWH